jgi:hypothetical protein
VLIGRELGVELGERTGDAYRDATGELLDGEWLGAFAQPSVILNKVTPVSLRIDGREGRSIDEYGEARLDVSIEPVHDRIEIRKDYGRLGGEFVYVGRMHEGTLAGYWYSTVRPQFAGVFWMARADRLAPEVGERLRRRVRRNSPKRALLKAAMMSLLIAGVVGVRLVPALGFVVLGLGVAFVLVLAQRTRNLGREVELWRRQL